MIDFEGDDLEIKTLSKLILELTGRDKPEATDARLSRLEAMVTMLAISRVCDLIVSAELDASDEPQQ
jgi:hypothetical protein